MTKAEKIAVSLPPHVVASARRAVDEGRASSVSAYLATAADQFEEEGALRSLVEALIEEHGRPSADDYGWARRELGLDSAVPDPT